MGQFYQDLDAPHFDYQLNFVGDISDTQFRGPPADLSRPYIACVGAAQTFGRFCASPFPEILGRRLGIQVVNLGVGGAGSQRFLQPEYLSVINNAECVVLQVLSGRSEGNSLFDNRQSGGLVGVRLPDQKTMRFEEFVSDLLMSSPVEKVKSIVEETRENYVRNTAILLKLIKPPKILFWFSSRPPEYQESYEDIWNLLGEFPQLVNRSMVDRLVPIANDYVECISSDGLPQRLWESASPIDGTKLEGGQLLNLYYPSQQMHERAAEQLAPTLMRTLLKGLVPRRLRRAASDAQGVRFAILAAGRTGSNLLRGMLHSHPEIFVGGELFNPRLIEKRQLSWCDLEPASSDRAKIDTDERLLELRETDPAELIDELMETTREWGYAAVGFKWMYWQPDPKDVPGQHLISDKDIRIIHLKRRNLLRRLLSLERAEATGRWAQEAGREAGPRPTVAFTAERVFQEVSAQEAKEYEYDRLLSEHDVLEIFYEDLASDPQIVGARAVGFLGLSPIPALAVAYEKTGTDSLSTAISNYAVLKQTFRRWASFFDE